MLARLFDIRSHIFRSMHDCVFVCVSSYLEQKAARLVAETAETERARTRLRRESEWMAKQPK